MAVAAVTSIAGDPIREPIRKLFEPIRPRSGQALRLPHGAMSSRVLGFALLEEVAEFGVLAPEALVERAEDAEFATRAMRSRIDPMKKVARMLRGHRELILNWFRAKKMFSSGVEGLNAKAKVTTRKAYGFKVFKTLELALYHNLGALPEPKIAHRFF